MNDCYVFGFVYSSWTVAFFVTLWLNLASSGNGGLTVIIPWSELGLAVVGGFAIALAASSLPAYNSTRMEIVDSLRYE